MVESIALRLVGDAFIGVDLVAIRDDARLRDEVAAPVALDHVVHPGEHGAEDHSVGHAVQQETAEVRSVEEDPEHSANSAPISAP